MALIAVRGFEQEGSSSLGPAGSLSKNVPRAMAEQPLPHGRWVGGFEFGHGGDEGGDAFGGKGVVDAGTHAADAAVAFQAVHPALLGEGDELVVQVLVPRHEGHVHSRPAGLGSCRFEELTVVESGVELAIGVAQLRKLAQQLPLPLLPARPRRGRNGVNSSSSKIKI